MSLPNLLINKRSAKASLIKQINEGEKILSQKMTSAGEIQNVRYSIERWHRYNKDMLMKMFDSSNIVDEYFSKGASGFQANPTINEKIEFITEEVES